MAAAASKMEVQLQLLWAQYERGLAEAEKATQQRTSRIGQIFDKAGKSYQKAITKNLVGMFGVGLADQLTKGIIDSLKNPQFGTAGANIAYAVGDGFAKAMEHVPIAGAIGKAIGEYFSGNTEEMIQSSREAAGKRSAGFASASDAIGALERQRKIVEAISEDKKQELQRTQEIDQAATSMYQKLVQQGLTQKEALDQVERLKTAYKELYAAQDEAQQRLERDKYWEQFWGDYFEGLDQAADDWDKLVESIERGVNKTIDSATRERDRIAEDIADERANMMRSNNIQGIATAAGSVRVAGSVDYSSARMSSNIERMVELDQRIKENTDYLKNLRPA